MANSKCCKYTSGNEVREYSPKRWTLSTEFPSGNNFNNHKVTSPSKFDGKTIKKIKDDLIKSNDKENLCSLHYTIDYALNNITQYKNNQTARDIKKEIDDHCEKCPKKDYKCKCKKKLGDDYDTKSAGCEEGYSWNDKKCACKKDTVEKKSDEDKGDVSPVEEIKGCMDDDAVNYNPEATVKSRCEFEKEVELKNEFCFCTKDDCRDIGRCIKGMQIIKGYATSKFKFDRTYDAIYERALEVIAGLDQTYPDFRISTEKGFYSEDVDSSYIEDLAKALTILEYRGYSLSSASKGNRKDSDMLMKSPGGEYLGFFSGASMTAPLFDDFNLQFTPNVIRKRISTNLGGSIPTKYINGIKKYINNIPFDIDSEGIIVNTINEGLINVLKKEPIGLAKLLK